ncbi:Sialic acid transporter NanT [Castellaniella defragrans]
MTEEPAVAALPSHWYDGLTRKHWQVLQAGFLGWIFDGYEAMAIIVVLVDYDRPHTVSAGATSIYAGSVIGNHLAGLGPGRHRGRGAGRLHRPQAHDDVVHFPVRPFLGLTAFANGFVLLCALRFLTGLAMGSEWGTGAGLGVRNLAEPGARQGAGIPAFGFGWGTPVVAIIWVASSFTHPLGQETGLLLAGVLPALGVLYLRRGLDESEKWQRAVRESAGTPPATAARARRRRAPATGSARSR